jgi:hypothetical protein
VPGPSSGSNSYARSWKRGFPWPVWPATEASPSARPVAGPLDIATRDSPDWLAKGGMSVFRTLKQRGHNPVSAVLEAVRSYLQTGQLPPLPAKATEIG